MADEKLRLKRALDRYVLDQEAIEDRMRLQMKDDKKIEYSDYVIKNNLSKSQLYNQMDNIINKITNE